MFKNRQEAGKELATKLQDHQVDLILGIPRGGVILGKEISQALKVPLDVIVTKKIGAPNNPELAIGAIGPDGEEVINEELALKVDADELYLQETIAKLKPEVERRVKEYHDQRPPLNLKDKRVVLTDDGAATGATMLAAIEVVRQHDPKQIIVALPVAAKDTLKKIKAEADEVICLKTPLIFFAVGQFYQEFNQVSDQEVISLLK